MVIGISKAFEAPALQMPAIGGGWVRRLGAPGGAPIDAKPACWQNIRQGLRRSAWSSVYGCAASPATGVAGALVEFAGGSSRSA